MAALVAGGFGGAGLLLVVGIRGTVVDPTRPRGRLAELIARPRSPLFVLRMTGGASLAVVVEVVTRWPVAALGLGGLVAFWPALMGGSRDEQQQIVRLEAVVTWCEALRDTTTGHAGLEQAIPATAANAAPAIRPALLRLTGQLRSKVPLEQGLQDLAEQLNHSADLIIAALQMNVRTRGDGLVGVLTNLALAGREELDLRRKITAGRAGDRRAVQLMLLIVLAVATFLVLFSDAYTAPYRTVAGQIALAVVMALFATSFLWIRKLAMAKPATPFLPVAGHIVDPMEARIIAALTGTDENSDTRTTKRSRLGNRKVTLS
ncbi:type II secretion system F family protein [Jatrophihabitans sp. YIM 134969]